LAQTAGLFARFVAYYTLISEGYKPKSEDGESTRTGSVQGEKVSD
jgi:hypothetical protein